MGWKISTVLTGLISLLAFAAAYVIFFISAAHGHGMTRSDTMAVTGFVILGLIAGAGLIVLVRRNAP